MSELSKLKHALSSHRRRMREHPGETEQLRRHQELEGRKIQIQLEAEELRHAVRISLAFLESYRAKHENGVVAYKYLFGWEPVRDEIFRVIAEKEKEVLAKIQTRIELNA